MILVDNEILAGQNMIAAADIIAKNSVQGDLQFLKKFHTSFLKMALVTNLTACVALPCSYLLHFSCSAYKFQLLLP